VRYRLAPAVVLINAGALLALGGQPLSATRVPKQASQYTSFKKRLASSEEARHAIERLTFGSRPGNFERFQSLGRKRWIDEQLHPERITEDPNLEIRLQRFSSLWMSPEEAVSAYPRAKAAASVKNEQTLTTDRSKNPSGTPRVIAEQLAEAKIMRALFSNHQLAELLDDFWFNHFNVFLNKGADRYFVPSYERETIRPHILGKFYDLLVATAQSPAMLFYLDNWQSVDAQKPIAASGKKRGLNENYGRELLELQTMGVNSGYTQEDVIEVARCFTGWTIERPQQGGRFVYRDKWHNKSQKVVLGHVIKAGGGMDDGLQVLALLAREPATAHFISWKLAQRFVADDPPPSLVSRMADVFLGTDGDIREVMRSMLSSREFWSEGAYRTKIKTPFEFVVSSLRATAADVGSASCLQKELARLGEPLYLKIEPNGYPNRAEDWVNSSGLLERMNFAVALARNRISGVDIKESTWLDRASDAVGLATAVLGHPPLQATINVLKQSPQVHGTPAYEVAGTGVPILALVLGSPEFQYR
jgi:uncharacterized protein (DUF1800 family)